MLRNKIRVQRCCAFVVVAVVHLCWSTHIPFLFIGIAYLKCAMHAVDFICVDAHSTGHLVLPCVLSLAPKRADLKKLTCWNSIRRVQSVWYCQVNFCHVDLPVICLS